MDSETSVATIEGCQRGLLSPVRPAIMWITGTVADAQNRVEKSIIEPAMTYANFARALGGATMKLTGDFISKYLAPPIRRGIHRVDNFLHKPAGYDGSPTLLQQLLRPQIVKEHGRTVFTNLGGHIAETYEFTQLPRRKVLGMMLSEIAGKTVHNIAHGVGQAYNILSPLDDPRNPWYMEEYANPDIVHLHPSYETHQRIVKTTVIILAGSVLALAIFAEPIADKLIR